MNAYADTSFLISLYVQRIHTGAANAQVATMKEPIHVASFLQYEFANGIRLAAYRKTISQQVALAALAAFDADMDSGRIVIAPVAWEAVHREAERLSNAYTLRQGHRSFDILHVATALTLGAKEFLSFDGNQRKLAVSEGLKVRP